MALPVNIEDLLSVRHVESNRIEFKRGWNPDAIYRSLCAFANDIDNLGGGYIIVGVEEKDGKAIRPVFGVPEETLDKIQKEIIGYNNQFVPQYFPRISVESVDGESVIVIWAPTGADRPYAIPSEVTSKIKKPTHYVRYGTSSIVAKGELMDDLRDMADTTPFDERGNPNIKVEDISFTVLAGHLAKVKSRLAKIITPANMTDVLEQMNLMVGPSEFRMVKNVAAMMFCEHPEKFFPVTQVDIVTFPEGRLKNPSNIIEAPKIVGPVPSMIQTACDYIRTNVIKEQIVKQKDMPESLRFFNYPYQAIEEAIANALYHRDYRVREPVEITIEPDKISILSFSGPDRSISLKSIKEAKALRSRRYRNRRLGDFLKELDLTEGRSTGIPTIQGELERNGSPLATIETNEERSYFLMDIPINPLFAEGETLPNKVPNKVPNKIQLNISGEQGILQLLEKYPGMTSRQLAEEINISDRAVRNHLKKLKDKGLLVRVGARKSGHWEVLEP